MKKTLKNKPFFLCCILVITIVFTAVFSKHNRNSHSSYTPVSRTDFFFDTVITITLYDSDKESLLDQVFSICQQYEQLWNKNIKTSDIARINQAGGNPVDVSEETIYLLQKGIEYSKLTDGSFDITMQTVEQLWDFTSDNNAQPPNDALIQEALRHTGYEHIIIDGNTVTLTDPKTQLDLGALAKGYIADQIKNFLSSHGVTSGIIDLGGNLVVLGRKPDNAFYYLGIQQPFDSRGTTIAYARLADSSFVTSGIYERYFMYQDKCYHHILNTKNGYPVDNNLLSATIISSTSLEGDALSTSCMTLGLEKATELIASIPDVEAVFIDKEKHIYITDGLTQKNNCIYQEE